MSIKIHWQGVDLDLEGSYSESEPSVGYLSGEFLVEEVWYTPPGGKPERQRALENIDGDVYAELCELGLKAIEKGSDAKGGDDYND